MIKEPDRNHPYRLELYKILEEREWLDINYEEIIGKYARKWIGIHDREVIAVADTSDALRQELAKRGMSHCRMTFLVPSAAQKFL